MKYYIALKMLRNYRQTKHHQFPLPVIFSIIRWESLARSAAQLVAEIKV